MKPLLLLGLLLAGAAALSEQVESHAVSPDAPPHAMIVAVTPLLLDAKAPSARQAILQRALEDGDVCGVNALLEFAPAKEIFSAFLGAVDASGDLLETYGPRGPLFASLGGKPRFHSLAARAAWALRVGGFDVSPLSDVGSNPHAALTMIEGLERENPGNAFFPLVRLVLEYRLGYSLDRLKVTAEAAAGSTILESPLRGVIDEVNEASWKNPALRFLVSQAWLARSAPLESSEHVLKLLAREAGFRGVAHIMALQESSSELRDGSVDAKAIQEVGLAAIERVKHGVQVCDSAEFEAAFFEARDTF